MHTLDNAHNTWGESDVTKSMVTIDRHFMGIKDCETLNLILLKVALSALCLEITSFVTFI